MSTNPISNQPVGLGFAHRAGRYQPGGSPFSSPGCWSFGDREGFQMQGWETTFSGAAERRCCSEGQLLPRAGSVSSSQSAISQWGWGLHTVRCEIDPGDLRFRPRAGTEGFMTRRWSLIFPWCGKTSTLSRGETIDARQLYGPQPISNQPLG